MGSISNTARAPFAPGTSKPTVQRCGGDRERDLGVEAFLQALSEFRTEQPELFASMYPVSLQNEETA